MIPQHVANLKLVTLESYTNMRDDLSERLCTVNVNFWSNWPISVFCCNRILKAWPVSCIWSRALPTLTEIAFVIFHPRNSSFCRILYEKVRSTVAHGAASDNQFINISNPDPFTPLKLISTKYVFPKSCSQIPIPIQFFCQIWSNQRRTNLTELFIVKKSPQLFKAILMTICLHLKYRFSVSLVAALSLIFVLENSKPDPEA